MAFTTLAALVSALDGLSLASEKKHIPYRPKRVNAADLPLRYCRLPDVSRDISTLTYGQGLKQGKAEVVIIVEFIDLNTQDTNDALAVTLMDELTVALEAAAATLGMDSYSMTNEIDTIAGGAQGVMAIIATVEVSG